MFKMSEYSFVAGLLAVGLALICYALAFASVRLARRETTVAADGMLGAADVRLGIGDRGHPRSEQRTRDLRQSDRLAWPGVHHGVA